MTNFKGFTWHRFWYKSSRGSDMSEHVYLHPDLDPQQELDYWLERNRGASTSVEYGRTKVHAPPRGVMKNMVVKTKRRAERYTELLKEYERILEVEIWGT